MGDEHKFDVDAIIAQLLAAGDKKPGTTVKLVQSDLTTLCEQAKTILLAQPMLLEVGVPLIICGDLHGQFYVLLRIFDYSGHPPATNYMFLGDYVDRGDNSIETMTLLLAYKIKYPENFFLLRGNHEAEDINCDYGFSQECEKRYSDPPHALWKSFNSTFNCLPVAAIVNRKIFCCHGGLSPDLKEMDQIRNLERPTEIGNTGLLTDLLWSDPDENSDGWTENVDRGVSWLFGPEQVMEFIKEHKFDLVCRAHQAVDDGYEFFAEKKLITIFSAPNYGGDMNTAAVLQVDPNMCCTLLLLKPIPK